MPTKLGKIDAVRHVVIKDPKEISQQHYQNCLNWLCYLECFPISPLLNPIAIWRKANTHFSNCLKTLINIKFAADAGPKSTHLFTKIFRVTPASGPRKRPQGQKWMWEKIARGGERNTSMQSTPFNSINILAWCWRCSRSRQGDVGAPFLLKPRPTSSQLLNT